MNQNNEISCSQRRLASGAEPARAASWKGAEIDPPSREAGGATSISRVKIGQSKCSIHGEAEDKLPRCAANRDV
jgi:hypothetical protein